MSENKTLYDVVGDKVIDYLKRTYVADCIVRFEISYDGVEWDTINDYAEYCISTDTLTFGWDWCEGEKYIRNLEICHISEMLMPEDAYREDFGKEKE